ncbi:MAG: hypothetical protein ACPLQO_11015, partial [Desulfotomaculales bacterium]
GLAWLLKDMMRVLLVDCTFQAGCSDLATALDLPEYPHLKAFEYGGIAGAAVNVEPNLDALQAPRNPKELVELPQGILGRAITAARTAYDAIICDLPNWGWMPDDRVWWVREALENATTLVVVTVGEPAEQIRLIMNLNMLDIAGKELCILCNKGSDALGLCFEAGVSREFRLPEDPDMPRKFTPGCRFRMTGPFMKTLAEVRDAMYESGAVQKGGILRRIFGR